MASSNKTTKLGLNQWLPGDKPVFDDHNRDNANIESKVMAKADYTGSNAASVAKADKLTTPRTVSITGCVTGSASFDGSANVGINTSSSSLMPIWGGNFTGKVSALNQNVSGSEPIVRNTWIFNPGWNGYPLTNLLIFVRK